MEMLRLPLLTLYIYCGEILALLDLDSNETKALIAVIGTITGHIYHTLATGSSRHGISNNNAVGSNNVVGVAELPMSTFKARRCLVGGKEIGHQRAYTTSSEEQGDLSRLQILYSDEKRGWLEVYPNPTVVSFLHYPTYSRIIIVPSS
eukprot:scaffold768_cov166-Amphora_coffeaeformis.AAC.35